MREKLIWLVGQISRCPNEPCMTCEFYDDGDKCERRHNEFAADNLIANGVTIQRWIPVTERLPKEDADVLCFRGNHIGGLMDVYTYVGFDQWQDTYGNLCYTVGEGITHWMPLPEPPKGE